MLAIILASVWTIVLITLGIVTAALIVSLGVMLVIEIIKSFIDWFIIEKGEKMKIHEIISLCNQYGENTTLAEIRQFSEIALEISMNEYIEIAKEYSSDKSYVFINGVLNRVVNDLKAENQLFKFTKK